MTRAMKKIALPYGTSIVEIEIADDHPWRSPVPPKWNRTSTPNPCYYEHSGH